jgi:hypothetical protein
VGGDEPGVYIRRLLRNKESEIRAYPSQYLAGAVVQTFSDEIPVRGAPRYATGGDNL